MTSMGKFLFPTPSMNGMNGMNGIELLARLERAKSDRCARTRTRPRLLLPPSLLLLPRTLHYVRLRRRGLRRRRWPYHRLRGRRERQRECRRGRPRRRSRCIDPAAGGIDMPPAAARGGEETPRMHRPKSKFAEWNLSSMCSGGRGTQGAL
jgi:hypothetical protein